MNLELLGISLKELLKYKLQPVDIAVLDTGLDAKHDVLKGRIKKAYVFNESGHGKLMLFSVPRGKNNDSNGHGTSVASILATLAPNAVFTDYKVLDNPCGQGYEEVVLRALELAIESEAKIINMSLTMPNGNFANQMIGLLEYAYRKRKIVVVAAKNDARNADSWLPAGLSTCITIDKAPFKSPFTFHSCSAQIADFQAKGFQILAAKSGGGYHRVTGSSFATPIVSAIIALFLGIDSKLEQYEIKTLLKHHQMERQHEEISPLELMHLKTPSKEYLVSRRCKICGCITMLNDIYPAFRCQSCGASGIHHPLLNLNHFELVIQMLDHANQPRHVRLTRQLIARFYLLFGHHPKLSSQDKKTLLLAALCQYVGYAFKGLSSPLEASIEMARRLAEELSWNNSRKSALLQLFGAEVQKTTNGNKLGKILQDAMEMNSSDVI